MKLLRYYLGAFERGRLSAYQLLLQGADTEGGFGDLYRIESGP